MKPYNNDSDNNDPYDHHVITYNMGYGKETVSNNDIPEEVKNKTAAYKRYVKEEENLKIKAEQQHHKVEEQKIVEQMYEVKFPRNSSRYSSTTSAGSRVSCLSKGKPPKYGKIVVNENGSPDMNKRIKTEMFMNFFLKDCPDNTYFYICSIPLQMKNNETIMYDMPQMKCSMDVVVIILEVRKLMINPRDVFIIWKRCLAGLKILHDADYMHRNVETSTIIFTMENKSLLSEFQYCDKIDPCNNLASYGNANKNPRNICPELQGQSHAFDDLYDYGRPSDVWCLANAIKLLLLTNYDDVNPLYFDDLRIINNMLDCCLRVDPLDRPTVSELFYNDVFKSVNVNETYSFEFIAVLDEASKDFCSSSYV
uniref:Protein kinase domain-containing protein n=1 Tax=Rhabditophanes sp. KR3021 TaxID=114890 RepID=A0AC35UDK5_9BILA